MRIADSNPFFDYDWREDEYLRRIRVATVGGMSFVRASTDTVACHRS